MLLDLLLTLIFSLILVKILRMQLEHAKVYSEQKNILCIVSKGKYYFYMA